MTAEQNEPITLTLKVRVQTGDSVEMKPLADAWIYVDNTVSNVQTDADGKATVKLPRTGEYTLRAVSYTTPIVAPICIVTVAQSTGAYPDTDQGATPESDSERDDVITLPELSFDELENDGDANSNGGDGEGTTATPAPADPKWVIAAAVAAVVVLGVVIVVILRRRR